MKNISIARAAFISMFFVACSHFQGPGSLEYSGESFSPAVADSEEEDPRDPPVHATGPNEHAEQNTAAPAGFQLEWPVQQIRISQNFRPLRNPSHDGVDLTEYRGAPILAAHPGRVIYRGSQFHGYGRMIIIEYDDTWATLYAHLTKIMVKEGQIVKAKQQIGTMGRTGRATGTHLHFELMNKRSPVDPIKYLPEFSSLVQVM